MFDTSKVTDHHAIIPTGVVPQNLSDAEQKVFDLVARRFIGVFLPDCKFSTTTVLGVVHGDEDVEFKVTGKEILDPGWRVVRGERRDERGEKNEDDEEKKQDDEERTLPTFVKGESGSLRNGPRRHLIIMRPLCCVRWRQLVSSWKMRRSVLP